MRLPTSLALLGCTLAPIIASAQSTTFENSDGATEVPQGRAQVETAARPAKPDATVQQAELTESGRAIVAARRELSPKASELEADGLQGLVMAWARAWAAQDVRRYLDAYAPGFKPADGRSRKAWERLRRKRVSEPGNIQVAVNDIEVLQLNDDQAWVTFRQDYRSDRYRDSVRKRLNLVRHGERWLIAEEQVVATLAGLGAEPVSGIAAASRDKQKSSDREPIAAAELQQSRPDQAQQNDVGDAQQNVEAEEGSGGTAGHATSGIRVGSMTAYPGVDIAVGHDDNVTRQSTNAVSSPVVFISPYVILEGRRGPHLFDFRYRGKTAYYSDSPDDNYNNNAFQANARLKFGVRNDLALRFDLIYGSDPRGSTDRPVTNAPDRYREIGLAGRYGYGARGAKGRIEVDADYNSRRYTNNPQAAAESDVDKAGLGAAFYWRVKPKTRLLFQWRYLDFDYVDPANTLDSNEQLVYVGAQWDATAKTTGFVKYGRTWKNFASPTQQNDSSNSWDVGIRWSPRTYSVFDLSALQRFRESTGVGDSIVERRAGIGWTHAWNSRLSHNLTYAHIRDKYLGAGTDRLDETDAIGAKLNYQFRPWARFGAEYTYTDRDSNDPTYRYGRNVLLFTLGLSL